MFLHLSPKERIGYAVLGAAVLIGISFMVGRELHHPAPIELHETTQPPVSFDHSEDPQGKGHAPMTEKTTEATLVVDVAGAVVSPGLVTLNPGSRVFNAIEAAGGFTEDANFDGVNLAAKVSDGTQVYVPRRTGGISSGALGTPVGSRGKHPTGIVDINSADVNQLSSLPGIGPTMAQRIIDYRSEHGTFRTVDDLTSVQGFGKKKLEPLRDWLTAN